MSYQPDLKKADLEFKFEVRKLGKQSIMTLTIQSHLDKNARYGGLDAGFPNTKSRSKPAWLQFYLI